MFLNPTSGITGEGFNVRFYPSPRRPRKVMTELFTHKQAAAQLGVDPATLYRWRKQRLIACRKAGRWVRYAQEDIDEFVSKQKIAAKTKTAA